MQYDKIHNGFEAGVKIGPYEYFIRDLPIHTSYAEVFRSSEQKTIITSIKFNAFNYKKAQGMFFFIREVYDLIVRDYYKNVDKRDTFNLFGPVIMDRNSLEDLTISFSSDIITNPIHYPKDKVVKLLSTISKITPASHFDEVLKFLKFCKDFKLTDDQFEKVRKIAKESSVKHNKRLNLDSELVSHIMYGTEISGYKSEEEWDAFTKEGANTLLHNLFNVFALRNIHIACPDSISINDIHEFLEEVVDKCLNQTKELEPKLAVDLIEFPQPDIDNYNNLITIPSRGRRAEIRNTQDFKEWELEKIKVIKVKDNINNLIVTTPLTAHRNDLYITGNSVNSSLPGYLANIFLLEMFSEYLRKSNILINPFSIYDIKEFRFQTEDEGICTGASIYYENIWKKNNLVEDIANFNKYFEDNLDEFLDNSLELMLKNLYKFFNGIISRFCGKHTFQDNVFVKLLYLLDTVSAKDKLDVVKRYIGKSDDLLFSGYTQMLDSPQFRDSIRQAMLVNKSGLRFTIITEDK